MNNPKCVRKKIYGRRHSKKIQMQGGCSLPIYRRSDVSMRSAFKNAHKWASYRYVDP
ncbi:MAG: hypothetical protein HZB80_00100 [Deltaproteobacteria bacterium]|nr:hypothetical protein [Deltaproteobacteria bacterium]